MGFIRSLVSSGLAAWVLSGCVTSTTFAADEAAMKKTAAGNTAFALDLFAQLDKSAADKNVFLSPFSISSALAMTTEGARAHNAEQMIKVLHLEGKPGDLSAYHSGMADIQSRLAGDPATERPFELHSANALWIEQQFPLDKTFLDTTQKFYGAGAFGVDFLHDASGATGRINAWVSDQTHDKIKDLIPAGALDSSTALVLTNAIYFKGAWQLPFSERATSSQPFHISDSKDVDAKLMKSDAGAAFDYMETNDFQAISLPYKAAAPREGRAAPELSMLIFLPKKIDGLANLEKQLTSENLTQWQTALKRQPVQVFLPRFTMTSSFELSKSLQSLGMTDAFTRGADFTGISASAAGKLYISAVIHKAFVDVNEQGTEAAAATAVGMRTLAMRPDATTIFRADHPFLFLIRHEPTGSILFMGRVVNPK